MKIDIITKKEVYHVRLRGEEDLDFKISTKQEGYDAMYYLFQHDYIDAQCALDSCKKIEALSIPAGDPFAAAVAHLFKMRVRAEKTGLTQVYVRQERALNFYITGSNFVILTALPTKSFGFQAVHMLRGCNLVSEEEGRRIRKQICDLEFNDRDISQLVIIELIER